MEGERNNEMKWKVGEVTRERAGPNRSADIPFPLRDGGVGFLLKRGDRRTSAGRIWEVEIGVPIKWGDTCSAVEPPWRLELAFHIPLSKQVVPKKGQKQSIVRIKV